MPMTTDLTVNEMFESLTGREEEAISRRFGSELTKLVEVSSTKMLRALIFVHQLRQHADPKKAYDYALDATLREAQDYFADDEPEVDPDDPVTPSGNDSSDGD